MPDITRVAVLDDYQDVARELGPWGRLLVTTGPVNAAIDLDACADLGIAVAATGFSRGPIVDEAALVTALREYREVVEDIEQFLAGTPVRLLTPA